MAMVAEIGSLAVRIPPDPAGLATSRHVGRDFHRRGWVSRQALRRSLAVTSMRIAERGGQAPESGSSNGHLYPNLNIKLNAYELQSGTFNERETVVASNSQRKTKIVCTIGPSCNTRDMIWKLAEAGMDVARLNMSHGDHESHQKIVDLVKEYNAQSKDHVIAIMLDTKGPEVRSGDVTHPILLKEGQEFNFTIKRGISSENTFSVNYDDFVNDVEVDDILLVDGGMMSLAVRSKTADTVKCKVIDGGELKSRRHLNVRGKSATLPSITEKDWEDIKFGVDNEVDFYAVSFVKDAKVIHELKDYLRRCNADIHVIPKIESADSVPNLQSIISASDGAMVARGDLGAELPIEDVPLLQVNVWLQKYPLKAVKVMHNVASKTESTISSTVKLSIPAMVVQAVSGEDFSQSQVSAMFASHATAMANTVGTPIIVFTQTGSMAILLSHYRPSSTIFAFTNEERVKQRLSLYHGVLPIYMQFSGDAEETFSRAIKFLLGRGHLKDGEYVTLVQSGIHSIWRRQSTHHLQVRKVGG
ncbi:hypothetical protein C4D60_Mb08t14900 [Musa balbisiana]|uniref:Pyruvate kinase n=1 Tax=Musa balbisiana TaxID=52838 RepID=A0A4S8K3V9_MUSBA|nr:hypothetical protein C4D60_Mb08t14900 [Musa balbisiana]